MPAWLYDQVCPADRVAACARLAGMLAGVERTLAASEYPADAATATLRARLVHGWRRVILRCPDLPDRCCPESWEGPHCRQVLARLPDRLPRPAIEDLETEARAASDRGASPTA